MKDELTLKELILTIREYVQYFLAKWYWFATGIVLCGTLLFFFTFLTPVTYVASLSFLLNQEKESIGGAGAILGSLGLGGADKQASPADQLLEIAKSRRVLGQVLFDSAVVSDKNQLIADHLIEIYDFHSEWKDSEVLNGFLFGSKEQAESSNHLENLVFRILHRKLISQESGLISLGVDEDSGIFNYRVETLNPELSVHIVNRSYLELSNYFVKASISGKQRMLDQLSLKADSVGAALEVVESKIARFEDRSSRILLRQEITRGQRLKREALILSTMYSEVVKNKETTAFLLASERPGFNLIDGPLEPLAPIDENWKKNLLLGGLLGFVLVAIILFLSKLVRDAMAS